MNRFLGKKNKQFHLYSMICRLGRPTANGNLVYIFSADFDSLLVLVSLWMLWQLIKKSDNLGLRGLRNRGCRFRRVFLFGFLREPSEKNAHVYQRMTKMCFDIAWALCAQLFVIRKLLLHYYFLQWSFVICTISLLVKFAKYEQSCYHSKIEVETAENLRST